MTAIFGIISGFALILAAMAMGGPAAAFVNGTGILIVIFGTCAVTAISFTSEELAELPAALHTLLFGARDEPAQAAIRSLELAERARRDGLIKLPGAINASHAPALAKALSLLADGTEIADIERMMERETVASAARYRGTVEILRRAGEVAPAMGLIGTLIGLVQLLGTLDDPAAIGPAMAVALLTTFYGAVLAHMVFLPLAARADRRREAEYLLGSLYSLTAVSIGRQENPRRLEMALNALLPPNKQVQYF
ncbi:MAG: motility protein A [Pseudomonadota bacterium]